MFQQEAQWHCDKIFVNATTVRPQAKTGPFETVYWKTKKKIISTKHASTDLKTISYMYIGVIRLIPSDLHRASV